MTFSASPGDCGVRPAFAQPACEPEGSNTCIKTSAGALRAHGDFRWRRQAVGPPLDMFRRCAIGAIEVVRALLEIQTIGCGGEQTDPRGRPTALDLKMAFEASSQVRLVAKSSFGS
jgi:hypothetical protein